MKKNVLLYILLTFLIVVNVFFLYNYLGSSDDKPNRIERKGPTDFIVKALKFDDNQIQQFEKLNETHHQNMRKYSQGSKKLKDKLFSLITVEDVSDAEIDSIISLLGAREQEREKLMFYNLRSIKSICNDEQKVNFEKIIKDALSKAGRGGPPGGEGLPPKGEHPEGRMDGPPPHGRPDGPLEDMPDGPPPPIR